MYISILHTLYAIDRYMFKLILLFRIVSYYNKYTEWAYSIRYLPSHLLLSLIRS